MIARHLRLLVLTVVFSLPPTTDALSYPWPVSPFTSQHPISGVLGEYRVGNDGIPNTADDHFHAGVDIAKAAGTAVYPVANGTVVSASGTTVRVNSSGAYFDYVHITPSVKDGSAVTAGTTILGTIAQSDNPHLHFEENDGAVNPLPLTSQSPGLTPFSDSGTPTVNWLKLVVDGTDIEFHEDPNGRVNVYGPVDIMVNAKDAVSGSATVAPYKIGYEILDEWGLRVAGGWYTIVFNTIAGYSLGLVYDKTQCDNSNYVFWATNTPTADGYWNATYPEGTAYTVRAYVGDIKGNSTYKEVQVVVSTTDICITVPEVVGGLQSDTLTWAEDCGVVRYNIYRSDHCWGPYYEIASFLSGDSAYTEDGINYAYVDHDVSYSRPYWYMVQDNWFGGATPQSLPASSPPSTPASVLAANVLADCGDAVRVSWTGTSADSYYVFRSQGLTMPNCPVLPDFVGATADTQYLDNTVFPGMVYSYSVIAWNESGSSSSSESDSVKAVRELEGLSASQSIVSVSDSVTVCPGGDAGSLWIGVTLSNECGEPMADEPASSVYAVLAVESGNATVLSGDTLRPAAATDATGHTQIVAYHIGGCGTDTVRVYARGQLLNQRPILHLRSPDLNADGDVNELDWGAMVVGGVCADLNWDGTQGDALDWSIFNGHWQHTHAPSIALIDPDGSEWWQEGDTAGVSWQFIPSSLADEYNSVDILLSRDGGTTFPDAICYSTSNDGSYEWPVPTGITSGDCRVKIEARDVHGCMTSGASSGGFAIARVVSGLVDSSSTWDTPVSVAGDVTVAEGKTLTLDPGVRVRFAASDALHAGVDTAKCEFTVLGSLDAEGSPTSTIEFSSLSASPQAGDWRGIRLRPSSAANVLDNCVIEHAYNGIEACSTTATVNSCSISHFVNDGIKSVASAVTITKSDIALEATGTRGVELALGTTGIVGASASGEHTCITGASSGTRYGIEVKDDSSPTIKYVWVSGPKYGIKCSGTSSPVIEHDSLDTNAGNAIQCAGEAIPTIRYTTLRNFSTGITAVDYALPDLGSSGSYGNNRFYLGAGSNYHVANLCEETTVMAGYNWWGACPPPANRFYGSVDQSPCLQSEPMPSYEIPWALAGVPAPSAPYVMQNYPNPFNPQTTIEYGVSEPWTAVRIVVYDISGRVVKVLVDEIRPVGHHSVVWDGSNYRGEVVVSGVYVCDVSVGSLRQQKKLVVLR